MVKIIKNFLNYFVESCPDTENLDFEIHRFLRNNTPAPSVDLLENVELPLINKGSKETTKSKSPEIASYIRSVVNDGINLFREEYIDTCNFLIYTINGKNVDSMSAPKQKTLCEQIKTKAESSPIFASSHIEISSFGYAIFFEWSLSIPLRPKVFLSNS